MTLKTSTHRLDREILKRVRSIKEKSVKEIVEFLSLVRKRSEGRPAPKNNLSFTKERIGRKV